MMLWRYLCLEDVPIPGETIPAEGLHGCYDGHYENMGRADMVWGVADYKRPLTNREIREYGLEYLKKYEMEEAGSAHDGEGK